MDHQTIGGTKIRPAWIVAAALAVIALVAFGVPLVSLLYVGILLLCPLMMAGMHGGHGQAHDTHAEEPDRIESPDPEAVDARAASPPPPEGGRT